MIDFIENKKLSTLPRLACFFIGLIISSFVFVWGFTLRTEHILGYTITLFGYNFTNWVSIAMIVLIGVFGGYLIQAGLRGKLGY